VPAWNEPRIAIARAEQHRAVQKARRKGALGLARKTLFEPLPEALDAALHVEHGSDEPAYHQGERKCKNVRRLERHLYADRERRQACRSKHDVTIFILYAFSNKQPDDGAKHNGCRVDDCCDHGSC
jgi:hypothetical protein